jgi:hypothetical protein
MTPVPAVALDQGPRNYERATNERMLHQRLGLKFKDTKPVYGYINEGIAS